MVSLPECGCADQVSQASATYGARRCPLRVSRFLGARGEAGEAIIHAYYAREVGGDHNKEASGV